MEAAAHEAAAEVRVGNLKEEQGGREGGMWTFGEGSSADWRFGALKRLVLLGLDLLGGNILFRHFYHRVFAIGMRKLPQLGSFCESFCSSWIDRL